MQGWPVAFLQSARILTPYFRSVTRYFRSVTLYFRSVTPYFRSVTTYFRSYLVTPYRHTSGDSWLLLVFLKPRPN